jgi:hypothetical protein
MQKQSVRGDDDDKQATRKVSDVLTVNDILHYTNGYTRMTDALETNSGTTTVTMTHHHHPPLLRCFLDVNSVSNFRVYYLLLVLNTHVTKIGTLGSAY